MISTKGGLSHSLLALLFLNDLAPTPPLFLFFLSPPFPPFHPPSLSFSLPSPLPFCPLHVICVCLCRRADVVPAPSPEWGSREGVQKKAAGRTWHGGPKTSRYGDKKVFWKQNDSFSGSTCKGLVSFPVSRSHRPSTKTQTAPSRLGKPSRDDRRSGSLQLSPWWAGRFMVRWRNEWLKISWDCFPLCRSFRLLWGGNVPEWTEFFHVPIQVFRTGEVWGWPVHLPDSDTNTFIRPSPTEPWLWNQRTLPTSSSSCVPSRYPDCTPASLLCSQEQKLCSPLCVQWLLSTWAWEGPGHLGPRWFSQFTLESWIQPSEEMSPSG